MANINNLFVDAGSDYAVVITAAAANGMPLNLTDFEVKSQMRKSYQSSLAHTFTSEVINPVLGKIKLSLTANQTQEIMPGRWLYDVEITKSDGARKRIAEGVVTVTPQITQI